MEYASDETAPEVLHELLGSAPGDIRPTLARPLAPAAAFGDNHSMLRDRDHLARRLAAADEEIRLLRRATTDLAFAGRTALDRRQHTDEPRRSSRHRPQSGSPARAS